MDDKELADLLIRLQNEGDSGAFRQILDKTTNYVYCAAMSLTKNRALAEDLTEEVFVVFTQKYRSIKDPMKLRSWLAGTALRKRRGHSPQKFVVPTNADFLEKFLKIEIAGMDPFKALCELERKEELEKALQNAMANLPERLRTCLMMLYFEQKEPAEAAKILGVSVKTVYSYCSRAVVKLSKSRKLKEWL